jgi:DNA-binding MarR family transcriptional regulator
MSNVSCKACFETVNCWTEHFRGCAGQDNKIYNDIPQYRMTTCRSGDEKMTDEKKLPGTAKQAPRKSRCNISAVKKAARRLSLMYDTVLAPTGLKSTQYGILSELNSRGAALPTVGQLAEELVMDRSTLGQNLRPLERDQLVTLLTDPRDRRSRLIALTQQGMAKLNEAAKYWRFAQDRFEAAFGKQEAAELRSVLYAIAHNEKLAKQGTE